MVAMDSDFKHKSHVCRITYITMLAIAILFMVSSVVLLAVYFSSAGLIVSYIQTNPQSNGGVVSLTGGLTSAVEYLSEFFKTGIAGGRKLTGDSINGFISNTTVSITVI